MPGKGTTPTKKKRGPKGPRLKLTPAQCKRIGDHAMAQCKDHTIAHVMGIPAETFKRNYGDFTHKKRSEGKAIILAAQFEGAKKNPTMMIWWGKQHLGQTDRLDVDAVIEGRPSLPIIVRMTMTARPRAKGSGS